MSINPPASSITDRASTPARVLITGVSGFVGQQLAAKFLNEGHSVVGVDLKPSGFSFSDHENFEFCAVDLTDPEAVSTLPWEGVDLLYHLAAAGVKAASRQWPLCVQVNVMGTASLMQVLLRRVAENKSVPRIVYTKTYYEDHLDAIPAFRENPYVVSKVAATRWIEALSSIYPSSITIAKVFQVYGAGDDPNNVLSYAARTLKDAKVATFGSGTSLRDWIYIDDFIDGLIACGASREKGLHHYDLGSGERHSIREMVEKIAEIVGAHEGQLVFDPSRDRGDTEVEDWAKKLPLGWKCESSISGGMSVLVKS